MAPDRPASPPPPPGFGLRHDPWGRLVLIDAEGRKHVGVEPVRAFPIADPGRWISLCDGDGHEIAWVEDLAALPPDVRRILEDELAQREFIPVLRRIVRASSDSPPSDWEVETDRGPTRLSLHNDDDVRRLGPHRALIVDAQGLRYLVPDLRVLDAVSRRILEHYF
ncbi:MAG TPA: DUF1854 domain-containing protein [Isosphaeraceae bacterium]